MKQAHKALLYSAAIFPGSGHFLLRHMPAGFVFAGFGVGCIVALVSQIMAIANDVSQRILSGELPFDIIEITRAVSAETSERVWVSDNLAIWLLLACYLLAAADAYRLGLRRDRAAGDNAPAD